MKLSTFWIKFKIVPDKWLGYEVLIWRWWFPMFVNLPVNTFTTKEKAIKWIEETYKAPIV